MAKLAYPLRFSSWPLSHYRKLDHELSLLFRRSTRNQPTFPTALLYLPTSHGGMGLKRLSDLVQLDKWSSLHRLLRGDRQSEAVGISFIHQAYRRAHIHPPYNSASTYAPHPSPASPSWLTSLFDWGAENNISFHTGGLIHLCGEVTLNTWIETLPPGLQSRSFYNDVETYADMRVWNPTTEAWTWPDTHPIFGTHTATIGPFWGNETPQIPPHTSSRSTLDVSETGRSNLGNHWPFGNRDSGCLVYPAYLNPPGPSAKTTAGNHLHPNTPSSSHCPRHCPNSGNYVPYTISATGDSRPSPKCPPCHAT